ncbi:MAG: elongation factor P [Caldilineaceae bacterium]|nr:elongation factor P [Caldilineaceae bacterium]
MATTSDLRKGMLIRYNGNIHRVVEYQHISPGNWRAFVRMRLKNFETGRIIEDRVRAGSEIDVINTRSRPAQYLYKAGGIVHFMDNESFDQIELPEDAVAEQLQWVTENSTVDLLMMDDGTVLDVAPPTFVTLRVVTAEVAVRGDTSTNLQKSVTVETGATVQVPAFVKEGDLLRIDTRSGEYVERAKE